VLGDLWRGTSSTLREGGDLGRGMRGKNWGKHNPRNECLEGRQNEPSIKGENNDNSLRSGGDQEGGFFLKLEAILREMVKLSDEGEEGSMVERRFQIHRRGCNTLEIVKTSPLRRRSLRITLGSRVSTGWLGGLSLTERDSRWGVGRARVGGEETKQNLRHGGSVR